MKHGGVLNAGRETSSPIGSRQSERQNYPDAQFEVLSIDQFPLRMNVGHKYPIKGLPQEYIIKDIDRIKKLLRQPWRKQEMLKLLSPHLLPNEQLTQTARAIISLGGDWTLILGHVLEYDEAYRFRLQDLANETDRITPKEVIRLFRLWKQRDRNEKKEKSISYRFTIPVYLFALYLWLEPNFSQRITKILPLLKPDEGDKYWMSLKEDYTYGL